jgi:hypothetical protein
LRKSFFTLSCSIILLICACKTGKIKYDNIYSFQDNFALIKKAGKYGVIDTSFRLIIKPTLDDYISYDLSPYFFDSWFYGIRNDSLLVYDTSGQLLHYYKLDQRLTPNIISDQSYFIDSIFVKTANDTYLFSGSKNWGCINYNGDTIVPFEFENVEKGLENHIIASRGEERSFRTYVYNFNADTIWRTYNVRIIPWKVNNYYFFKSPEKSIQIWNSKFETLDTIFYDGIKVSENFVWLKSEDKWNRFDTNLVWRDGTYTDVHLNKYWGAVWKDSKVALINSKGEFLSSFIYEGLISDYTSNSTYIVARNEDFLHVLNANGKVIVVQKRMQNKRLKIKKAKNNFESP